MLRPITIGVQMLVAVPVPAMWSGTLFRSHAPHVLHGLLGVLPERIGSRQTAYT